MCPSKVSVCLVAMLMVATSIHGVNSKPTNSTSITATDGVEVVEIVEDTISLVNPADINMTADGNGTVLVEVHEDTILVLNTKIVNGTVEVINGTTFGTQDISVLSPDYNDNDNSTESGSDSDSASSEEDILLASNKTQISWISVIPACGEIGCGPGLKCDLLTKSCRTATADI